MVAFIALHLWQSTLFLLAAWLLTLAFKRNAAEIRYCIWFAASLKFLVPLALLQSLGDRMGRALPEPPDVDPTLIDTANALFSPSIPGATAIADGTLSQIHSVAVVIWAVGAAMAGLRWFLQWRAIHSTLASTPRIPMDFPVPVCVTSNELTPGVFGVFRTVVILPRAVLHELGSEHLQAVLAHEACHIRRRDNLTAAIHKCVETIFWFHPLLWWIGAHLLREREMACDESVIEAGHAPYVYAESILNVCRLGVAGRLTGVAASTGGDLKQRVASIMSEERAQPIGHGRFVLLLSAVMLVWLVPISAGVVDGAMREAAASGPIAFDAIVLKPSQRGWWRSTRFDPEAGRLVLKNFSLRHLIASAYPGARVNGERDVIDRARYDIEASWHASRPDGAVTSERKTYRELLKKVLRRNFNVQLYVNEQCDMECE
jgi:beta-lactamase regulating signal transducer with metallopeptidase domain